MIAAVRVRGTINKRQPVEDTMRMLRLYKVNYCSLLDETPVTIGMLNKVKDFVTWGVVDEETKALLTKNSKKNFFTLEPPVKGYGRKGIKKAFTVGGALGDRKEKINDLLKRMIRNGSKQTKEKQ